MSTVKIQMPDMSVADLHTASCDLKIKRQRHLLRFKPGLREVLFSPVELLCSAAGRSAALRGCTTPLVFRWWWLRSPCNKRPKMLTSFNLVNLTRTVTKWFSSGAKIHRASQNESGWISKVTRLQLALFLFDLFPLLPGYQEVAVYWSQLAGYHYLWLLKPPSQIEATVLWPVHTEIAS